MFAKWMIILVFFHSILTTNKTHQWKVKFSYLKSIFVQMKNDTFYKDPIYGVKILITMGVLYISRMLIASSFCMWKDETIALR